MTNVIYVGNYPCYFTDEDILSIFEDFEGLVLLRSLRKKQKCYSFILCQDQEQVVDIVLSLHDADVEGRNLIVRASDDELQEMLEECAEEDEVLYENEMNAYSNNYCTKSIAHSSFKNQPSSNNSDGPRFRQPRNPSRLASFQESSISCNQESQNRISSASVMSNHFFSTQQNAVAQECSYRGSNAMLERRGSSQSNRSVYKDTDSVASYAHSVGSRSISPSTVSSFSRQRKGEKFNFVSVINFPLHTTKKELEELFADYNPYKIVFRCNKARADKTPTEAVICFFKSKNATDAIINLDNTLYKGRVLIVMECEDIDSIRDLMYVQKQNAIHN